MACETERAARNSAALAVESAATAIDTATLSVMQLVAVAKAAVEALAARQRELDICEGNQVPVVPMALKKADHKDHVLEDCAHMLSEMRQELTGYFRKILK